MNEYAPHCTKADGEVHLHDLESGDRFRIPTIGRSGVLVRKGAGTAVVDYDGGKVVRFRQYEGTPEERSVVFFKRETGVVVAPCMTVEREGEQDSD